MNILEIDSMNATSATTVIPPLVLVVDADGKIVDRITGALKRPDLQQRLRMLAGEPEPAATPKATQKKAGKSSRKKILLLSQETPSFTF